MKKPDPIERELGIPIAGKILDPSAWARTALKKLPADGPLDLATLFGRSAPLVVDLGCGNGRFLISSAVTRADHDHIGIDILPMVLRYATRRGNQRGLNNLRFAAIDAQAFLTRYLSPQGVREVHCYHPQPFHHSQDIHKRLITPAFLVQVVRVLEPGGSFFIQTDNAPYWSYMKSILAVFFDFHEQLDPWPDAPRGRTRREIIALARGYPVMRGWGTRRSHDSCEQLSQRAATLPMPTFAAGPKLKDLDQLERDSR